jgi:formylglycine-generating enzyme required for sulfatase activity
MLAKEFTNSIGMKLVRIPAGKFIMGSPEDEAGRNDDESAHAVEITRAFYLGAHEVTKGQFAEFVAATSYQTEAEKDGLGGFGYNAQRGGMFQESRFTWRYTGWTLTDRHPVCNVSWNDATAFCRWLSRKEGRSYTLPTEAEWEYACRAGTRTRFWAGDQDVVLNRIENISDCSLKDKLLAPEYQSFSKAAMNWSDNYPFAAPVGSFQANPWGLYDMHGNLAEWCLDLYHKDYQKFPKSDPVNLDPGGHYVRRGGTWLVEPRLCRSAARGASAPGYRCDGIGFRVLLRPETQPPG